MIVRRRGMLSRAGSIARSVAIASVCAGLTLVGCSDSRVSAPAVMRSATDRPAAAATDSSDPGAYDADMTVSISSGALRKVATQKATFHLSRVAGPDGWKTIVSGGKAASSPTISANKSRRLVPSYTIDPRSSSVLRVETVEATGARSVYLADGTRLESNLSRAHVDSLGPAFTQQFDRMARAQPDAGNPAVRAANPSTSMFLRRAGIAAMHARFARTLGKPRIDGGLQHYTASRPSGTAEYRFDPVTGVPVSIDVTGRDGRHASVKTVYTKMGDGLYARTSLRAEFPDEKGGTVITEIALANVTLNRSGGR